MFNLISCDKCGYLDSFDKFLDETQPDFFDRMKILGWNLENPNTMSYFQTMYAGAACSECGNFESLDFNPFDRKYVIKSPSESGNIEEYQSVYPM